MRLTKEQILHEIRRTAEANGGAPLGARRLARETGIKPSDWQQYWARLSDAQIEIGLERNEFSKAYSADGLLAKYAELAQAIGQLPTENDLEFKTKNDETFPSRGAFRERLGPKHELVKKLSEYCAGRAGLSGVLQLCQQYEPRGRENHGVSSGLENEVAGYVYLVKHGSRREYRVGSTDDPIRREGELRIQLPERLLPVHVITTDDRFGIEAYWHKRFAAKKLNGDWFDLDARDVAAFKRRRFM
jgi:Meiotically up-regulated gene 113